MDNDFLNLFETDKLLYNIILIELMLGIELDKIEITDLTWINCK